MKHNCKIQKKKKKKKIFSHLEWTWVNGGWRIRVRNKATERRKRSKVKEREGEESMVC